MHAKGEKARDEAEAASDAAGHPYKDLRGEKCICVQTTIRGVSPGIDAG